jgi:hypothetical protein
MRSIMTFDEGDKNEYYEESNLFRSIFIVNGHIKRYKQWI